MPSNKKIDWISPLLIFVICLVTAIFNTGTKIAAKYLHFVNPILVNCIHFIVILLMAQPFALIKCDLFESRFTFGKKWLLIALVLRSLCATIGGMVTFYAIQVHKYYSKFFNKLNKKFILWIFSICQLEISL